MDNPLNRISYGLYVVTSMMDGKKNGFISNTVIQSASSPLTLTICITKTGYTHDMIVRTGKFNVSILDETAEFDLFKRFGMQSGRNADKFKDFSNWIPVENGLPVITKSTNAYFCCDVLEQIDLGSHSLFIASVVSSGVLNDKPSITYADYYDHVKPKPEAPRPKPDADSPEQGRGKPVYRCTVCGALYEGPGDHPPDDYICPVCGHGPGSFELVYE